MNEMEADIMGCVCRSGLISPLYVLFSMECTEFWDAVNGSLKKRIQASTEKDREHGAEVGERGRRGKKRK